MNIVLIGPMGAGKTTVGKILAGSLDMKYISVDKEAHKLAGPGITKTYQIHERWGVGRYRTLLTRVISSLLKRDGLIVDCGEGIVVLPEKEKKLKAIGKVILLIAKPEILWKRIKYSEPRTYFLSKEGDPYEIYKRNLRLNKPFFSIADIKIDTTALTPEEMVERVVKELKKKKE